MTLIQYSSRSLQSNTFSGHLTLLLAALASTAPVALPPVDVGVSIRSGVSSSGSAAIVDTDTSMARVIEGLQRLAGYLVESSEGLAVEDKQILYANLWDMYG